jgi:hypothetical protein
MPVQSGDWTKVQSARCTAAKFAPAGLTLDGAVSRIRFWTKRALVRSDMGCPIPPQRVGKARASGCCDDGLMPSCYSRLVCRLLGGSGVPHHRPPGAEILIGTLDGRRTRHLRWNAECAVKPVSAQRREGPEVLPGRHLHREPGVLHRHRDGRDISLCRADRGSSAAGCDRWFPPGLHLLCARAGPGGPHRVVAAAGAGWKNDVLDTPELRYWRKIAATKAVIPRTGTRPAISARKARTGRGQGR